MVIKNTSLKLLKAPPNPNKLFAAKSELIPSDFFDPLVRKQSRLKTAILLVNSLNSYIRNPLFPDKSVVRRAP